MTKGIFLGEFEQLVLLAVVRLEGEGYGMTIRREIELRSERPVSIGAIYSTLRRLEEKGLVASVAGEPTPVRGGRAPRHFRVLPGGEAALRQSRRMLERMWEGVQFDPRWEVS